MESYTITYTLGAEEIVKNIEAPSVNKAMFKANKPTMWPNEFIHDYEHMFITIYSDRNAKVLRHYPAYEGRAKDAKARQQGR